ncbi:MAG: signal peptidase I [Candidatus Levybacteria bacterium]|nr:signal peptidase I [Candidatus Levybacteria bacterium]
MRTIFKWINILLSVGIFFVALGVLYVAIPYFGNQALVVRSGSMSPAIDAGSIVVVRAGRDFISPIASAPIYNTGDIIAFRSDKNQNTIITHRIVGTKAEASGVVYKTKGDANKDVDGWVVKEENVLGKASFNLPQFGYVLAFARSNLGFPLLIIVPALFVILLELYNITKTIREATSVKKIKIVREIRSHLHHPLHLSGIKTFVPILLIGLAIPIAFAFPSDTETSSNNVFTAAEDFFVDSSTTPTPPPPPTAFGIADHIVISEVQIATSGATTSDFVELYNPTSSSINLSGFHLVKRTSTGTSSANLKAFSSSDIIPAHGFYLWASTDGGYATQIGADVSTGENITSNNSVALLDSSDVIVDAVAWGSGHTAPLIEGSAFSINPGANQSMERKALSTSTVATMDIGGADEFKGNGFDLDDNSTDFILRTLSQPQNSGSLIEMP